MKAVGIYALAFLLLGLTFKSANKSKTQIKTKITNSQLKK